MKLWPTTKVAQELKTMNAYLALIAEVLQARPVQKESWGHRIPRDNIVVEPSKVDFPAPLVDAAELLARWLWLQLPEESKKDMSA